MAQQSRDAERILENQLRQDAEELEKKLVADVIAIYAGMRFNLEEEVRDIVENIDPRRGKLAVVLETTGGFIEVVERIVKVFRHHFDTVDFYVPNRAMSAGTVLAMSGDSIWMDYFSVLGPIDPQVPGSEPNMWVPALGYLTQYERLVEKSRQGTLTTAELSFMLQRFNPADLYYYEKQRDLSVSLLQEWLATYKFKTWTVTETQKKPVTDFDRRQRAKEIGEALNDTEKWHAHSRGLSKDVLERQVGLQIDDFGADDQLRDCLHRYHALLREYAARLGYPTVVHNKKYHRGLPW